MIQHGSSTTAFNARMVGACETCSSAIRECWDGQLRGDAGFAFTGCAPQGQCAPPPPPPVPPPPSFCSTVITSLGNMQQTCAKLKGSLENDFCTLPTDISNAYVDGVKRKAVCTGLGNLFGVTFSTAQYWFSCSTPCAKVLWNIVNSPLVLSFDGSVPKASEMTHFSFDGKSTKNTRWLEAQEGIGFLAYDFNADGFIRDGTELFGEYTNHERFQHGYHALARYFDRNGDAVIKGDELHGLVMWQDWNLDGVGQPEEVTTLESHGIVELDAGKNLVSEVHQIEGGRANPSAPSGVVRLVNGVQKTGSTFDVWFENNKNEPS